jgi:hypothetical protein
MTNRFFVLLIAAGLFSSGALAQSSPGPSASNMPSHRPKAPIQFDTFVLVLLVWPPDAPDIPQPELDQLQEQHIANIRRLHAEGKLLKAGPTEDQSGRNVRGISFSRPTPWRRRVNGRAATRSSSAAGSLPNT